MYYSPLRYPGGKSWLALELRTWLSINPSSELVELFAGGAFASLLAVVEGYVSKATLVELDPAVCAVWRSIFSPTADDLCALIEKFTFDEKSVRELLSVEPESEVMLAFRTIVMNRARRGGILAPGAGLLKLGERKKGMASRWYPETLCKRIFMLNSYAKKFSVIEGDALEKLSTLNRRKSHVKLFIDPPYIKLQERGIKPLYRFNSINHRKLFELVGKTHHDFLMTYDLNEIAMSFAKQQNLCVEKIQMRTAHAIKKEELLITRNCL
ncbi:MAG: DNA adenine methylase [Uliginosibacterium sp.]|nr:DNA adenine methylase [Uliginosibacterium sp.]